MKQKKTTTTRTTSLPRIGGDGGAKPPKRK